MGHNTTFKSVGLALLTTSLLSTSAIAGGFDRGGVNIDQLFDTDRFGASAQVTYVNPRRTIKNVQRATNAASSLVPFTLPPLSTSEIDVDGSFVVPRLSAKLDVSDNLRCLATYTEPYGADAGYGTGNAYSASAVEFSVDTKDYGLTCGYSFIGNETSVGESKISIIGGISYQEFDGFLSRQTLLDASALPLAAVQGALGAGTNPLGIGEFRLADEAFGYRIGAAYEIPEIALRAQIVYNSRYKLDGLSGTVDISDFGTDAAGIFPVLPVSASSEIPQSIEAKFQSGIRPGTLAFASVKWQQWSRLGSIAIQGVRSPLDGAESDVFFEPLYRDGYTVSAGIGQVLNEQLAGRVALTWDRGTSTTVGTQSDTWTLSAGLRYKDGDHLEVNFGGAVGLLTDGVSTGVGTQDQANAVTFSFDNDYVYAISGGVKLKY